MASNRNKRKLSSKQANRISLAITAIYFICGFVKGIIEKPSGDLAITYWFIVGTGTLAIYLLFYFLIFKGEDKERDERYKETEFVTMQYLSYTDFRQVYFKINDSGSHIDMMRQILQKEGCKFYAKLTENNNIYIIVKDKHDEEVYSREVENYIYFNYHFTFEE